MAARKTVRKGIAKVPVMIQLETLECGAVSLAMCLAYYGLYLPLEQMRKECGVSRDGSNLKNIYLVAKKYGLDPHAYRFSTGQLRQNATFPCIIYWDFNHFVVLRGFRGKYAYLNDPAQGTVKMPLQEFEKGYSGICLTFSLTDRFVPGGRPPSVLAFAKKRLAGTSSMFKLVVLTTFITSLIAILTPAFSRFFVDVILQDNGYKYSYAFFMLLALVFFLQIGATWIKTVYLLKLQGKMAILANTSFVWHVLRLPMDFFAQRMPGEVLNRQSVNQNIAATLIQAIAPMALDFASMVLYFYLMLHYSPIPALVGLLSTFLNLLLSLLITNRRINIARVQTREQGKLQGMTVSGIGMIETIKSAGAENGFFINWANHQALFNNQKAAYTRLNEYLGQLPSLLNLLTGNIVLFLGLLFIIQGDWTVGMVSAFTGYLSAFSAPATSLFTSGQAIQEMRINMERVEDVLEYPTDVPESLEGDEIQIEEKLHGNLEVKQVTFGYNALADPLLENFSLTLPEGKSVALVGGSGCGKSTIVRLVTGLVKPWSGEILLDGIPISKISREVFSLSVGCVDQEIFLYEDSCLNNIRMWDQTMLESKIIRAAQDAQIHEEIVRREGEYQHIMADGGRDFSGGQRQRIEIARALALEPSLLILDEATSALDAETENEIMAAIKQRHISCLIISHRLSIVRDCDEIIVMRNGHVVDRGRHEELMQRCAYYQALIITE